MRCTYTELDAQPAGELEVFYAFLQGENDARQIKADGGQPGAPA